MDNLTTRLQQVSTSSISDALDSLGIDGGLVGIQPRVPGAHCAGPAYTVEYMPISTPAPGFRGASNYIDEVPAGSVIVIDNQGKNSCTVWGDILTQFSVDKGIAGTVIHGAVRDISRIRALNYPLYSTHVFMQSGKNRVTKRAVGESVTISGVPVHTGDWIVADENGCVCIPAAQLETVLQRAENIEQTEERIKAAVAKGVPLQEARKQFAYHEPWKSPA